MTKTPPSQAIKPLKTGRPTLYNQERHDRAIALYASGTTMLEIAKEVGVHRDTLHQWGRTQPIFADALARAKPSRAASIAERPAERYQAAEEYLLAVDEEGQPLNPADRAKALITLADKRDGHDRWLAAASDPATYGPTLKATVETKSIQLVAFSDLAQSVAVRAQMLKAVDGDEDDCMPHVVAPDEFEKE